MGCVASAGGGNTEAKKNPLADEGYDIPKAGTAIDVRRVSTTDNLSEKHRGSAILYNLEPASMQKAQSDSVDDGAITTPAIVYNASDNIPFGSIFGNKPTEYHANVGTSDDMSNDDETEEIKRSNTDQEIKNIYYWCLKLQDINLAMVDSKTRDVFIGIVKESFFDRKKDKLLNRHFLYDSNQTGNVHGYCFSPKSGQLFTTFPTPSGQEEKTLPEGDYYKWEQQDSMLEFVLDYNQKAVFYRVLNNENEKLFEYDPSQYKEKLKQFKKEQKKNKDMDRESEMGSGTKKRWIRLFDDVELESYRFALTLKGNDYIKLSLMNPGVESN